MSSIKEFAHLRVSLEAIKMATNNFGDSNYVSRGGFGKVYKGELDHFGEKIMVAAKRLDTRFGQGTPEFWKEIMMLSRYRHENLVSLLGFCDEGGEKVLVYEYLHNQSLDIYLSSSNLSWIKRLNICIGAACGLEYLHNPDATTQRVLHRDIKSANILLDDNWNAKISDFGLSKFGPANQEFTFLITHPAGTFGYCDPLYVDTGFLAKESDVYSFGVVLFEVLCGRLCIADYDDNRRFLSKLAQSCYEEKKLQAIVLDCLQEQIHPDCLEMFSKIAYQCLRRDRNERPPVAEIVQQLKDALKCQVEYMVQKEKKFKFHAAFYSEVNLHIHDDSEQTSSRFEKNMDPLRSLIQLGDMSVEELKAYDGSDPTKPVLMAIKGQIYDVSSSRMFYGAGGTYGEWSGKDASRAIAKLSFEAEDLNSDVSGLGKDELEALDDWEIMFKSKYVKVGSIKKPKRNLPGDMLLSEEELKAYDGRDPSKPILMAINGVIYDVSTNRKLYGPGGLYHLWTGKDASRAIAKLSILEEDLNSDLTDLKEHELDDLQNWENMFKSKYVKVGSIKKTKRNPLGDMSEEELKAYDGKDPSKPILMAINGVIYDVSTNRKLYGPGGLYQLWSGKDASRAIAKLSILEEDLNNDLTGLREQELEVLQNWEATFRIKYARVGSIINSKRTRWAGNQLFESPKQCSSRQVVVEGMVWLTTNLDRGDGSSNLRSRIRFQQPSGG